MLPRAIPKMRIWSVFSSMAPPVAAVLHNQQRVTASYSRTRRRSRSKRAPGGSASSVDPPPKLPPSGGEVALLVEGETGRLGLLQDLRRPDHAPGVRPAEDRHEVRLLLAGVAEAAHHAGRHRDRVPLLEHDLLFAFITPAHRPPAGERDEHLDRRVRVERRALARTGVDEGEVEIPSVGDRRVQRRVLRDAVPDHVEDLALMAGDQGVEERLAARLELLEPGHALQHVGHRNLTRLHRFLLGCAITPLPRRRGPRQMAAPLYSTRRDSWH